MNLFNKVFKTALCAFIAVEFVSLTAYLQPPLQNWLFFLIAAIFLILALKKIEYGLDILLAELFIGGKGYLFSLDFFNITISIRMAFFTLILLVWLIKKIKSKNYQLPITNYQLRLYLILLVAIVWAVINGLLKNSAMTVYLDANAWLFFLLLPIFFTVIKSKKQLGPVLQMLLAAATWLALKTIIVLYLFSHELVKVGDIFYKWLRDTGMGEITYINGTLFRVFFQSHIYVLIAWLVVLAFILSCHPERGAKATFVPLSGIAFGTSRGIPSKSEFIYLVTILYLSSLTILISQSRSLWVGGAAGRIFLSTIAIWKLKLAWYKVGAVILLLAVLIFSQLSVINIITGNYAGNLLADRLANLNEQAAGASRINQLQPLTSAILKNPIFGSGFGAELTYKSSDPRVLQNHPDGLYTTYAFEWGYLDIWLKLGLIGLAIYLFLIVSQYYAGFKNFSATSFAFLTALTALLVVNIFSPYLNHPLGIGFIMLTIVTLKSPP